MANRFDSIVIGDGAAGDSVVRPAASSGKHVALVEKDRLGGECLNYGCVPSKALYKSAEVYRLMQRAGEFGVTAKGVELDFPAVMARAQNAIETIRGDNPWGGVRDDGIASFHAPARFVRPHKVEVDGQVLEADQIVIATGTKAGLPPIRGLAEAEPLTNESVFRLQTLPDSLAVIGAGAISVELSQIFQRFGSQVTLLEALPSVLPTEDEGISNGLQRVLLGEGVRVFTAAQVTRVQRQEDGSRRIGFEQEGQEHTLQVSEILVAAGRVPQTANLNLEAAGVETRRGWLQVDDEFRSNVPHIWGAGDVSGGMQFAHVAAAKGDAVFRNAMLGEHTTLDLRAIPCAVFSDPEVGHVGITEQQAIEQGIEYEVSRFDPAELDRSIIARDETGLIKLIATPGGEEILGAHILAAHGGDLINEIALAMQTRLTLRQLAGTIHAYPTLPESLRWAATSFLGE